MTPVPPPSGLRHEGLVYRGVDELIGQLAPFVADGIAIDEPVLVLERPEVIDSLEAALGADARRVTFIDMTAVGRNPGCIIPIWTGFLQSHGDRAIRGVGEPLWPGRSEAEAAECHVHEALINRVFADQPAWIMCPYDAEALPAADLEAMTRTHPVVRSGDVGAPVEGFNLDVNLREALATPLPEPASAPPAVPFVATDLALLRAAVASFASRAGLPAKRCADAALVISELATNSIRHGGGRGTVRSWTEGDRVVYEVTDTGRVRDPSVGRLLPSVHQPGGRGLWLVNQICDLVQLRTSPIGTTIRVSLGPA